MPRRTLVLMWAGIIYIFAVVWGGGYWLKTDMDRRKVAAEVQADADAYARKLAAEDKAEKRKAEARRVDALAKEQQEKKDADNKRRAELAGKEETEAKIKLAESRDKRVALFTQTEKRWWDQLQSLEVRGIDQMLFSYDYHMIGFLVDNADLLGKDLVRQRLIELAVTRGVGELLEAQKITDPSAKEKAKLAFAMIDWKYKGLIIATSKANSASELSDVAKSVVRQYPELFPRFFSTDP